MSILNVNQIQPVGGGNTITVSASDVNFSGNISIGSSFVGTASTATLATTAILANTATVATNAQGLTGTPDITVNNIQSGVVTATTFIGNGSGLTGVTASGSGINIKDSGSTVGVAATVDFGINLNVSPASAGIVTVTVGDTDFSIADKIVHTGDTNTAIRFPADDTVTVETGGAEKLRITGIGSVGIGTNNPSSNLQVINPLSGGNFSDIPVVSVKQLNIGEESLIQEWVSGTGNPLRVFSESTNDYGFGVFATVPEGSQEQAYAKFHGSGGEGIVFYTGSGTFQSSWARLRITSAGNLLVNTATSRSVMDHVGNGPTPKIQIEATNSNAIMSIISAGTADANRCGTINLGRHRNGTVGATPTIVNDNDALGAVVFSGGDGGDMLTAAAKIHAEVDGTPGANDMPGALVFSTTPDGQGHANNTERLRIDSDGAAFFKGVSSGSKATINLESTDPFIRLYDTDGTANRRKWDIRLIGAGGFEEIDFRTINDANNSFNSRMQIEYGGDVNISDGNLRVASGHGIDFSATADGSGTNTSELLDDYEEGSWTPNFTGVTYTPSIQFGRYTKIGRYVYCTITIDGSISSGGNNIGLEGLPFTAEDAGDNGQRSAWHPANGGHMVGLSINDARFRVNGSTMQGVKGATGNTTYMTGNQLTSGTFQFTGDFSYYTAQ